MGLKSRFSIGIMGWWIFLASADAMAPMRGTSWSHNSCWMEAALQVVAQMKPLTDFLEKGLDKNNENKFAEHSFEWELTHFFRRMRGIKIKTGMAREMPKEKAIKAKNLDPFYYKIFEAAGGEISGERPGAFNDPGCFIHALLKLLASKAEDYFDSEFAFNKSGQKDFLFFVEENGYNENSFPREVFQRIAADYFDPDISEKSFYVLPNWLSIKLNALSCEMPTFNVPLFFNAPKSSESADTISYELYGVIMSVPNYHHTALVKQETGEWYYYDGMDGARSGRREKISEERLKTILSKNTYDENTRFKGSHFFYRPETVSLVNTVQMLRNSLMMLKNKLEKLGNKLQELGDTLQKRDKKEANRK